MNTSEVTPVALPRPLLYSYPIVSIIIPCRDEEAFIGGCLDSVIENDFPKESLEVLVVDGMSQDGTRAILERYAREYGFVTVLDNPGRTTPTALNIGIRRARGTIVMRMDAHAQYDKAYISRCIEALGRYKADNVGGIWKTIPRTDTLLGRCIVSALSHPFGVGNSHFRLARAKEPMWVDTVPFFCVRRWVFQELGVFNESLVRGEDMEFSLRLNYGAVFNEKLTRGQDMEFSLRLRRAGARTLLVPDIVSSYYARSDLKSFWLHNWINGVWAVLPFAYSSIVPVSPRHLVPLVFVGTLVATLLLSLWSPAFTWGFLAVAGMYTLTNIAASLHVAWRKKQWSHVLVMPLVFLSLHVSYGLGSLWGMVKLLGMGAFWKTLPARFLRRVEQSPRPSGSPP